ncbi:hypothetical protein CXX84_03450 [Arthrobacter sp. AFG7.2]|uniref:ATP-grasp domain-containing protein n=1 Tax=Arthrobacter sp. AFG7.2 TaxID=1688693 RepID=UPI000C9E2B0F|nr:ATP-grasp domain-containing protein [Arthrobacter sp. AFG7.2]PNI10522.1 hypothetical protein CXX84_03450 [Arthrobacter sp. AFG7.2]
MTLRILLASAGRRNYLVEWFKRALAAEDVPGQILVGDCSPDVPAQYSSDGLILLPRVNDPNYGQEIALLCQEHAIDLALSLNDYENSLWSELGLARISGPTKFICLPPAVQTVLEDKLLTYYALAAAGLNVPLTVSAFDILYGSKSASALGERIIIKNRYGSGSFGLLLSNIGDLSRDLETSLARVRDVRGREVLRREQAAHAVVLQRYVRGREYGVDVINDFHADFAGVLARKKIVMRDGETASATTVSAAEFEDTARALAHFAQHRGLMDTDIICDDEGKQWLIDVNPRFGGGYPFSHFAGADVPRAYVRWAEGKSVATEDLLSYTAGVTSHKTFSIVGERS